MRIFRSAGSHYPVFLYKLGGDELCVLVSYVTLDLAPSVDSVYRCM